MFLPDMAVHLHAVTGSVVAELPEQLCQENLHSCSGEEARRTAGESVDPLGPVHRHCRSGAKARQNADFELTGASQSHCTCITHNPFLL